MKHGKTEREWDPRWSELNAFAMEREISVTPFTDPDWLEAFYDFFEIRKKNRRFAPVPTGTDLYGGMTDLAGEEAGRAVAAETERLFGLPLRLTRFEDAQELMDELSGPRGLAPFFFVFDALFCEYEGFTLCFLCGTNN